ncbi:MAG TPA: M48 family metallopeptidase, partial [Fervidobacterium sp.]|nr:M48 family metallopeptidase [Fervidobacterium sp.]
MGYFVTLFLIVIVFKTIWEIVIDYINLRYSTGPDAKIPDILKDRISVEDFEKSKKYLKDTTYFGIVGSLVSLTVDIVFVLKLFPVLEHALSGKWSLSIQALLFFGIYTLIDYLVGLPFSIYSTFVIEEKYGFNTTKPRLFFKDQMLNVLLTVLLGIPVLLVLMWLLSYPIWWWQVSLFAIALVVFISFVQPVLIAPLFYKFSKLENEELERKLRDLLEKAKVKVPNIYKIDASKRTKKQNAYLTGIGKSRRLVLFDTILTYSDDEILAIVGHELGHHVR